MDLRSLSLGERIAAVCGVVLIVLTFVPWLQDSHAWTLFGIVDVLLTLLALTAVALPVARAFGAEPPVRPSNRTIILRAGIVALIISLAYLIEAVASAQVGLWLAPLAAAGIVYGAITMPEEEDRFPHRRDRARRPAASEGYEEPPPGMERWRDTVGDLGEEEPGSGRPPAGRRDRSSEPSGLDAEGPSRARRERPRATWDDDEPWGAEEAPRERDAGRSGSSPAEPRRPRRPPEVPRSDEP